jgi:HupE / UreJ protein
MTRLCRTITALALAIFAHAVLAPIAPALAHKPSDSYLRLAAGDDGVLAGQWDIALRDLDVPLGLDGDDDGAITWGEVQAAGSRIFSYALARLQVGGDDRACGLRPGELLIDRHSDGAYAVLRFEAACAGAPGRITVGYDLFADVDPQHRGLLRIETGSGVQTAILGPGQREATVVVAGPSSGRRFVHYVWEGVWHIWIGFDHILFLIALLLPAVLVRRGGRWHPEGRFRTVLVRVLKIVTAFTVAHTLTLSLVALEVVSLPSRLIESVIAASVVLSALNNLVPMVRDRLWMVAFGFGLAHGFGFANVLLDLGLPRSDLVLALIGFNAGVELGQMAIVAAFLPLAYVWRSSWTYSRLAMPAGSVAVCALACLWLVERAFDLALPPL